MKKRWGMLLVPVFFCGLLMAASLQFGDLVDKSLLTDLHAVAAAPEQFAGKISTVQGKIVSVCQKRGCSWQSPPAKR